jgi:hypothetical protein
MQLLNMIDSSLGEKILDALILWRDLSSWTDWGANARMTAGQETDSTNRLMQIDVGVERGVLAGVADTKNEFAWIDDPFVSRSVPVAEGTGVECERDMLGFAWS